MLNVESLIDHALVPTQKTKFINLSRLSFSMLLEHLYTAALSFYLQTEVVVIVNKEIK